MKKWFTLLLVVVLAGCSVDPKASFTSKSITLSSASQTKDASLYRCVDGDTAHFLIEGIIVKIRFLSIDSPEVDHENDYLSEPYGLIASDYTCLALTTAKTILIETDPYEDRVDQYGRSLAWIWVDEVLLNAQLIELGYAEVAFVKGSNLHSAALKQLETKAIKTHQGIWKN